MKARKKRVRSTDGTRANARPATSNHITMNQR